MTLTILFVVQLLVVAYFLNKFYRLVTSLRARVERWYETITILKVNLAKAQDEINVLRKTKLSIMG